MSEYTLHNVDCLDLFQEIEAGSVDAVITDPPYGTTACKWDSVIPFEPMWTGIKHVLKSRGAVALCGQEPFTSALVMSNPNQFRYRLVWLKIVPSGHLNANIMPMKWHEDIIVFYKKLPTYNPIMRTGKGYRAKLSDVKSKNYGRQRNVGISENDGTQYRPKDIIGPFNNVNSIHNVHPTQKPVALLEYLIRTYTNSGDTVLDFAMGSGTTGVAAMHTGRNFIGIELDADYFAIAQERIAKAQHMANGEMIPINGKGNYADLPMFAGEVI